MSIYVAYLRRISMFYMSIVLNIRKEERSGLTMDSVSVLLVSSCLLPTPSDKSCTSLLFARADLTLSGNPSTEEELYWAGFFLGSLQNWEIEI